MRTRRMEITMSNMKGPSIIVEPDAPWRFVFWSGAQYVACLDLGQGVWFTPEWLETNSPDDLHCYEPIMDKRCRYSRVEILESGDARARVKWHYACCNVKYEIFHGNTEADEYYTIYPDGIAVRKLVAWPGDESDFGGNSNFWQVLEYILVNHVGTRPDQVLRQDEAFMLMNEKGEKISFEWPLPTKGFTPLCQLYPQIKNWELYIGKVGLKDRPSPFVAFFKNPRFFPYEPCVYCGGDHPVLHLFHPKAVWKHWPANPMENFVLAVEAEEDEWGRLPTHTSFLDCNYTSVPSHVPPRPSSWLFLIGASASKSDEHLLELVKSWVTPARIETEYQSRRLDWGLSYGPVLYEGYSLSERAYVFRLENTDSLKFTMKPVVKTVNPVIRVENWRGGAPRIRFNSEDLDEKDFKWQFDGQYLTVWTKLELTSPVEFAVE
ncbi:MAG: hypothetical protein QW491_00035 [Thermoproteota archaeon]